MASELGGRVGSAWKAREMVVGIRVCWSLSRIEELDVVLTLTRTALDVSYCLSTFMSKRSLVRRHIVARPRTQVKVSTMHHKSRRRTAFMSRDH